MNFATLKGITIPEGVVKELAVNGQKVWSGAPAVDKYSWDGVFASIDAGTYATDYAIGDCVPLDLGSEGLINMQIAAFDTDDLADGSGKAKITWIAKELLATSKRMNPGLVTNDDGSYQEGTGSIGGWDKCEMRTYLKDTIKPLIVETVSSRIVTVKKATYITDTNGELAAARNTNDDVWLLSSDDRINYTELYTGLGFSSSKDHLKKYKVGSSSASDWWLRSTAGGGRANFHAVTASGSTYLRDASAVKGIAICFCTN